MTNGIGRRRYRMGAARGATSMGVKLYAICLVKNKDDVVGQTLIFATCYCDKIFVIDNGSTERGLRHIMRKLLGMPVWVD